MLVMKQLPGDDPDLGAPNEACPGGGPGVGAGGSPASDFPNCDPIGNVLMIQNENDSEPDDSPDGGCIVIEFIHYVVSISRCCFLCCICTIVALSHM